MTYATQSPTCWWVIKLAVVKCFSCGKLPLKILIRPGKSADSDVSASQLHQVIAWRCLVLLLSACAQVHLVCMETYMGGVFTDVYSWWDCVLHNCARRVWRLVWGKTKKNLKNPLYSSEVHNFEPLGKDRALLIGALCNVIIPSLFVIKNNSLGAIYHLIYSDVPREFCIMVRRRNKFQTIAGHRKSCTGLEDPRWRKKSKSCAPMAHIVGVPDGIGWRFYFVVITPTYCRLQSLSLILLILA